MNSQARGSIPRREQPRPMPLSAAQTRLWILHQFDRCDPSWNRPLLIRLTGQVDVRGLEWSLGEVVRRHEVLRTVFPEIAGEPVQIVGSPEPVSLEIRKLEYLPRSQQQEATKHIAVEETQRVFDLAKGPLFRAVLLRLSGEEHVLLLLMHHIVFDEWSEGILLQELSELYAAFRSGNMVSPLPELPIQYGDFSLWEQGRLTDAALKPQLDYWTQRLQGLSPLLLPTDFPRNDIVTHQGTSRSCMLPLSLVEKLKELSRRERVTFFMTLLTAFQILLSRYTDQEDITVGVPVAGRTQIETEGLIGYFVNLLVLRVAVPSHISFREVLSRVRDAALDAYEHQDVPFQKLVKELRPGGAAKFAPLFQVMFELRNLAKVPVIQSGELRLQIVPFNPEFIGALDLTVEVLETPDGLNYTYRYPPALFRPDTIRRMAEHFRVVLQCMVDNPEGQLSDLPVSVEATKNQPTVNWDITENKGLDCVCVPQPQVKPMVKAEARFTYPDKFSAASSKIELEEEMVRIWRTVLGLNKVKLSDNFFEVGGHSLLMIEVSNRISTLVGKKISAMDLCRYPTIETLIDYLEETAPWVTEARKV